MILYGKAWWGIPLLFRVYGSALPRAQPFAIIAVVENVLLTQFAGPIAILVLVRCTSVLILSLWPCRFPRRRPRDSRLQTSGPSSGGGTRIPSRLSPGSSDSCSSSGAIMHIRATSRP